MVLCWGAWMDGGIEAHAGFPHYVLALSDLLESGLKPTVACPRYTPVYTCYFSPTRHHSLTRRKVSAPPPGDHINTADDLGNGLHRPQSRRRLRAPTNTNIGLWTPNIASMISSVWILNQADRLHGGIIGVTYRKASSSTLSVNTKKAFLQCVYRCRTSGLNRFEVLR